MTARIIHGILTLFLLLAAAAPAQAQLAPWQPLLGPGGRVYTHGAVTSKGPYWAEGFQGNDNYKYRYLPTRIADAGSGPGGSLPPCVAGDQSQ